MPKLNQVMFTSASEEWETPREFFDAVNEVYHFDLDVCATRANTTCKRYFTKADNGLIQTWSGVCWMNPLYGREISLWVWKAYESSLETTRWSCAFCPLGQIQSGGTTAL